MNKEELIDLRQRMRHSAAHVMADVVKDLYPEAKLAIGPPTEDGFYYDFLMETPFSDADLKKIEKQMRRVINKKLPFVFAEYSREEMLEMNKDEPLKLEIISGIPEDEIITTYTHGSFEDLCAGPHVDSTGDIIAFKLLNVAGAYWRGDESNVMLQRIYGTAWESKEALDGHLNKLEEARKRDHRTLGNDLDLFSIHEEIGPGLILWHPKGSRVRNIFEDYWKEQHYSRGYDLIYTPNIGRANLWETSGHLDFFRENMFSASENDGQAYFLKPMNCPFHIMYYKSSLRSYRDLPMKVGELGTVYRHERGGTLHGMLRVRGFTQDDAHIFCRPDQIKAEVNSVLDLTFDLLGAFGFADFTVNLSTRPEKAVGSDEQWELAENSLKDTLEDRGISFDIEQGGGAFYGPKIDVNIKDAIGRSWQCTTVQFDFNLPERFGLKYIGEDGGQYQPYMVHRALFGSLERFMGILIEHYAGAFPLWLAPVQVVLIPVADRHIDYANVVCDRLRRSNLRVEVDSSSDRMNRKIRTAQINKIPYMFIVGDREIEQETVSVRRRSGEDLGSMQMEDIMETILTESSSHAI
ncbi:MAG: threonine--tRNA ligase [Dehalococcoidia bacterium]|nr:threonine--tRNA ligase [Dehalococcoidia bacterium]